MSAFAKSCTEILPPNLPKMEKKKKSKCEVQNLKNWGN